MSRIEENGIGQKRFKKRGLSLAIHKWLCYYSLGAIVFKVRLISLFRREVMQ